MVKSCLLPSLVVVALGAVLSAGCGKSDPGTPGQKDNNTTKPEGTPPPNTACGLIYNGDAEHGSMAGWALDNGGFNAAILGPEQVAFSGAYQFASGDGSPAMTHQDIDMSPRHAFIDSGYATVHLGGMVRNSAIAVPLAYFELAALDAGGMELTAVTSQAYENDFWMSRRLSLALPIGTRFVRATLKSDRGGAPSGQTFFDDVDLCIDDRPPLADEELKIAPYLTWVTTDSVSIAWEPAGDAIGSIAFGPTAALGQSATALPGQHQRVRLSGLQPDTTYSYQLTGFLHPGVVHTFHTAPLARASFSFVVWSDNQDGTNVFGPLAQRMAAAKPRFAIAAGDLVDTPTESRYHNQLLAPLAPLSAEVPFLAAPGNHDESADPALAQFSAHLAQPDPYCFGWSYGNIYFLFLDSTSAGIGLPLHMGCKDAIFASDAFKTADLRVAVFHNPPRIEYWNGGGVTGDDYVRLDLEPQLIANNVNVVFNGHAHLYSYGPASETSGVTWVTTGGGGGALESLSAFTQDWRPKINTVFLRHHFLLAEVADGKMKVSAIADDGEVLHTFNVP